jgi:hypothetical protein
MLNKIIKLLPYGLVGRLQYIAALVDFKHFEYRENTVLLLELYDVHGEVLPGLVKYLLDLGYNVDVIFSMTGKGNASKRNDANLFAPFENNDKVRIKSMAGYKINRLLRFSVLKHYKHIVINSFEDKDVNFYKIDLFKLKPVCMMHNPNVEEVYFRTNKIISLVKMDCINREPPLVVNSHYFGNIQKKSKSKVTTFVTFNTKKLYVRNLHLLFNACDMLHKKKITNFQVKIIGNGITIPPDYKNNFLIFNFLDFKDMFSEISTSDFLLGLIDASSVEYTNKASGSYQLSYGFLKPIVLHSKFANCCGFINKNSILYNNNSDLADAMENCINMSETDYDLMIAELEKSEKKLYNDSMNNLKQALNN